MSMLLDLLFPLDRLNFSQKLAESKPDLSSFLFLSFTVLSVPISKPNNLRDTFTPSHENIRIFFWKKQWQEDIKLSVNCEMEEETSEGGEERKWEIETKEE